MTTLRQAHKRKYTCIDNSLAQNTNLSLRAIGMMVRLLSLPDDWKIHLNQLNKVLKEGRRVINSILDELKAAGYIHHQKMGFKDGWQYFVFESPINPQEFKEFLRTMPVCEEFQNANSSQDVHLQSNNSSTKSSSKIPEKNITKDPPSADASECFIYFLSKLREKRPSLKDPNEEKWTREFDLILRIDKISKDEIIAIIDWIEECPNSWYRANVLSPAALRKHLDKLALELQDSVPQKNKLINRKWVMTMKDKYPEQLKKLVFDKYGVTNPSNSKDVSFSMRHEEFREIFIHIFGGEA